jgi:NAD(P)-dependent dehydrogenase (short-subunit alcohol dehydrogenase family)
MTSQLYSAQMLLAGAAARHMVKSGIHGGILFITSIHGQMITTNDFLYGGMKAAIERSCKSLALELSPYRIRVNCIAPGAINVRHQDDAQRKYPYFTMVPLGRWGVEADIGRAAAFLLSDEADYITGETLRVDGGFALPGVPEGWAEPHPVDTRFVQAAYEQMLKNEEETDNG